MAKYQVTDDEQKRPTNLPGQKTGAVPSKLPLPAGTDAKLTNLPLAAGTEATPTKLAESGNGGSANQQTAKVAPEYGETLDFSGMMYDPTADENYLQALATLNRATANKPTYAATYDRQIEELYNQIVNRDKFTYDVNGDALYQQYAQQYAQGGKLAMQDTMGQAAAMTGGYGNSYAQTVGQQTYQGYMQQLNDKVPELYDRALAQYNQEGQDMLNQYSMLGDMRDTEYGRYMDALNNYWQNVSYQQQLADTAYSRGYTAMADQRSAAEAEYNAGYDKFLNQWNMQNTLDRQAQEQANWQAGFDYGKERDAVADSQWNQTFEYGKERDAIADERYNTEWEYGKERDAIADSQWNQTFEYGKERDAVADSQWQQTFEYGKERDQVADNQWSQQFNYNKQQDAKDEAYRQQTFKYQQEQDKQEQKRQQKADAKAEVLEILQIGGTPTAKQLYDAGMNSHTLQAYRKYFEASAAYERGNGAEHVKTMSSAELVTAVQGYIDSGDTTGLEMFLDDCVATGRMSEDQALGYYDSARNKPWTSYEDASATGYSNIMTAEEFRKRSNMVSQYGSYEKYLEAMHTKYMN